MRQGNPGPEPVDNRPARPFAGSPPAGRSRPVRLAAAVRNHHREAGVVRNRHLAAAGSCPPAGAEDSYPPAGAEDSYHPAGAEDSYPPAGAEEAVDRSWFAVPFNDFHDCRIHDPV
ncbi:hypothetical protein MGAD_29910 [Mycolicibacterium gadium]|uniref:Uncharacterized protein n=1 Tax=Mycolicibacterium gadium TaxID=1794 RepID=A0A7I7WLX4_MYCGU|nr:hypothetical protein MGAD_29910 [Mycolicibacterium gadium]